METYNVTVVCKQGSKQLLLVNSSAGVNVCVYDEHTGTTLMRLTACTVEEFERAIAIIKHG